jgi:perosamine synthetase
MEQLGTMLLAPGDNLKKVLEVINESGRGVALVVDGNRRLLGLVTDGDIRRGLISGLNLETSVSETMVTNPVTAAAGTSTDEILSLMNMYIRHIPVVDENRRLCDLVCFSDHTKRIPWAVPYIGSEEAEEVADSFRSNWLTMGPKVKRLEQDVADYLGVKHAVAVSNGTAALDVALKVLGIGPGDEVIIPAFTYIATANAVLYQHATPVLADIEPKTFNMDPEDVARKITPRTRCIMPIDYGGQSSDYQALMEIADKHGIPLVEDGAESLGAKYRGRKLCTFGELGTTSFHAAKVITTVEGGMVITDDDEHARVARIIRNQGEDPANKYHHPYLGHNYRMTDLHAAIGLAQFKRLDEVLRKRAEISDYYTSNLQEFQDVVTLPYVDPENKPAWFFYPILAENRDQIITYLAGKGVDVRVAWPLPIHKQPLYQRLLGEVYYPVAEEVAAHVLNLPIYYGMTDEEMLYVMVHLKDAISMAMDGGLELAKQ